MYQIGYFILPTGDSPEKQRSVQVSKDIPNLLPGQALYQCVWVPNEDGKAVIAELESVMLVTDSPSNSKQIVTLYHGSPNEDFTPLFGYGEDKHDYGRGFYLTGDMELAREWAVCQSSGSDGWLHTYSLDISGLKVLDFEKIGTLSWLAELMKHREADSSKRYRMYAPRFISKYGIDTSGYDIIKGWRADASYFYIAKAFVRDEVDANILEELLMLGDLGVQYCCKTEKAFSRLTEQMGSPTPVEYTMYNPMYVERDTSARVAMKRLIDSDRNNLSLVFSDIVRE